MKKILSIPGFLIFLGLILSVAGSIINHPALMLIGGLCLGLGVCAVSRTINPDLPPPPPPPPPQDDTDKEG